MKSIIAATLSLMIFAISGCAQKAVIPTSSIVPAATGHTKLSIDENDNAKVQLRVEHLAPPQNLQPPKAVYVVWVKTPDNQHYILGQLKVDKNLEGKMNAITPFKTFRIVISAEDFPTVKEPGDQLILTTEVLEAK